MDVHAKSPTVRRSVRAPVVRAALLGVGAILLLVSGNADLDLYEIDTYTNVLVYVVLALAVNLVIGYLGILDFTAILYFGFGAYTSVILESRTGWPVAVSWLVTVAATVVLAALTAFAMSRLTAYFLAIASLALVLIGQDVASNLGDLTGGGAGFIDIEAPFDGDRLAFFYLCGAVALVFMFLLANLMAARSGRAVRAVRDSSVAAASIGINVARYRASATLLGASVASVAGLLYAHQSLYVSPDTFGEPLVLLVATAVVVGGLGTTSGSIVAAVLMVLVPRWLAGSGELAPFIYSVLVILLLLFAPRGLAGAATAALRALDGLLRRGRSAAETSS